MEYEVLIVSDDFFHFHTLSYLINNKLNSPCFQIHHENILQSIADRANNHQTQIIVLWDYKSNKESILLHTIKEINEHNLLENASFCVYNFPRGTQLETFFIHHKIQAVLYDDYDLDLFIKALKSIQAGEIWYSRQVLSQQIHEMYFIENSDSYEAEIPQLTSREKEILYMIAAGKSNQEIASELFISMSTVKSHVYNIFRKIEVPNRIQAALWTVKHLNNHFSSPHQE